MVAHNKLRTLHGSQPLVWSEDLASDAQKWCEELALNDVLEHDNKTLGTDNQGENIAAANVSNLQSGGPTPELLKNGTWKNTTTTTRRECQRRLECQSITLRRYF